MTVEIDPGYYAPVVVAPRSELRFFRCEELPFCDPSYTVVARDIGHAKQILRDSGCEFGDPSKPYDAAEADGLFAWDEIDQERAARIHVDFCGDRGLGRVLLTECELGDWFSSEY